MVRQRNGQWGRSMIATTPINVLLIDDDFGVPDSTFSAKYGALERRDRPYRFHYETAEADEGYSVDSAMQAVDKVEDLALLLLDIKFGPDDERLGLEMLDGIRAKYPLLPILMLTSLDADLEALELAMERGANEYLVKSPSLAELESFLRMYTLPGALESEYAIWGNAPAVRHMRAQVARVAVGGSVPVLVTGETGTGKELVARAVHRLGPRRTKPIVAKNCAHSDTQLLDAELFGQEKGSFTGAETAAGLVEQAEGGVLFLDEIGDMPIALQGKLLRLLETKTYRRVGASSERQADFQLVTATNRALEQLVESGEFMRDLYYRINVVEIIAPPLRERRSDVPILAQLFLRRFRQGPGAVYPACGFTDSALKALANNSYDWPGNARQLRNIVENCVTMAKCSAIEVTDLPPPFNVPGLDLRRTTVSQSTASAQFEDAEGHNRQVAVQVPHEGMDLPRHLARQELLAIREGLRICSGNKAQGMRLLYPGQPSHYYYRCIYNAVRRAPDVIEDFPDLKADYEREANSRRKPADRSGNERPNPK